jgi:phage baseplate assembly protein W
MTGALLGTGIAFPPRVGADGRIATSDGEGNVREAIRIVLQTEPDERLQRPTFGAGLGRLLFEPNTVAVRRQVAEKIRRALASWEPRIAVQAVDVAEDPDDARAAIATVTFRLVATQALERVSVAVPLSG